MIYPPLPIFLGFGSGTVHSAQGVITCAVENAEHYRIQLAEIGEELHDPQPSRQGQTTISCSISKCLGTKRQESLHGRLGCGTHFKIRNLEVDHIISQAKGGTDHIESLQLLCGSCNRIKGDRSMEYLRAKLQLNIKATSR